MTQEPTQSTPPVSVHTSPQRQRQPPPWLSEALLILQLARDSALLSQIQQTIRVPRGRMGTFEVCDFFLVLLVYAVSGELTLLALYAAMAPSVAVLAALWSRHHLPARSTLSRFLAAVTEPATEALRQVLFDDLLRNGLSGERVGGLVDRQGTRHVVFDVDGTRQVVRQRQVIQDAQHPPVRRRLDTLCAPGYPGRKRGELVRTRSTVQQAHTHEWLGTFGAAGNGDAFADLERACQGIARYLEARGLCPQQGVVRLDGLYGYVRGAYLVQQQGLGYVMRAADYSLLQDAPVQQVLAQPPLGQFVQPDTGTVRDVFEVGALDWATADHKMKVCCRVVITRRKGDPHRAPGVGKRQGDSIWELFVSDRDPHGLSALDLLSLYFARGGFEQTLAQEDQEQEPDRWCSGHPAGQESWQLLSQWVWNVRLRLGAVAATPPVRRTLWAEAQVPADAASPGAEVPSPDPQPDGPPPSPPASLKDPEPPLGVAPAPLCADSPSPATPEPDPSEPAPAPPQTEASGQVAAATGRGSGRFAGSDFVWTAPQQLRCPAGKRLRPRESTVVGTRLRIRYQARTSDCAACPLAAPCRGRDAGAEQGRRVTVWAAVPALRNLGPGGGIPSNEPDSGPSWAPPRSAAPGSESIPGAPPPGEPPTITAAAPRRPVSLGPQPVWWQDVPATALRRLIHLGMSCQRIEVPPAPPTRDEPEPWTRARRAHRRLSWEQRLARNAHPARTQPWQISLFGIPAGIATYLASLRHPPC